MSQQFRTQQQQAMVDRLVEAFGIDGSMVIFFNDDPNKPWLKAKLLAQIARRSGLFKVVRSEFEQFIEPLRQIVYQGTLVDLNDRIYSLPGVATIGEKIDALNEVVDEHDLAEARSLRSTFELAGFDPFDPTSVVALDAQQSAAPRDPAAAEALARISDNARIHILAKEKGLIIGRDFSGYRKFLADRYGEKSVAGFDPIQRKSVIEALERYEPSAAVPAEFAELPEGL